MDEAKQQDTMPVSVCQRRLTVWWLSLSAATLVILIAQTMLGVYGDQTQRAWTWLLPNISPTAGLLISTVLYQAFVGGDAKAQEVDTFAYRLAAAIIVFYFAVLIPTFFVSNLVTSDKTPIAMIEMSSYWLGPLQGVVEIVIGFFFMRKKTKEHATRAVEDADDEASAAATS